MLGRRAPGRAAERQAAIAIRADEAIGRCAPAGTLSGEPNLQFARLALRMALPDRHHPCLPFGAVIARQDQLQVAASNEVRTSGDPTAHAEIVAIRQLATANTTMADCVLYASCEPCLMCAAAIARSGIRATWYCASREMAVSYGFPDVADAHMARTVLPSARLVGNLGPDEAEEPFRTWQSSGRSWPP